jgi:hypothetical protein
MRNLSGKYRTRHNSKARFRGSPSFLEWTTMDGILWQIKRLSSMRGSHNTAFANAKTFAKPRWPRGCLLNENKKMSTFMLGNLNIGKNLAAQLVRLQSIYYCINSKEGITMNCPQNYNKESHLYSDPKKLPFFSCFINYILRSSSGWLLGTFVGRLTCLYHMQYAVLQFGNIDN